MTVDSCYKLLYSHENYQNAYVYESIRDLIQTLKAMTMIDDTNDINSGRYSSLHNL